MSSRERKRKKTTTKNHSPTTIPIPSLPDDLMWNCFARVSRFYYPSLSLVSTTYRSLIVSPELYETRSLLGNIEICLYVCLKFRPDDYPRWFTLCRKPDRTQTSKTKKSSGYVLASVSSPSSLPLAYCSCLVALGSDIYKIGGPIDHKPSSSVSVLDCRTHTWRDAPSLLVKRLFPSACVVDGKIYVGGGCRENGDSDSLNSIEVFDSKTQTWDHVPSPNPNPKWELSWGCLPRSACIKGKFHLILGDKSLAYDPKVGKWDSVTGNMAQYWIWSYCTIDNVLLSFYNGYFQWYDTKLRFWKRLKGLVGLPKFASDDHVKVADYGGKLAVLWDMNTPSSGGCKKKMLYCAEISLLKCDGDEIWGMVEWIDGVLPVPDSYELVKVLAVSL
ncbi:hypothetical protein AALP_AA3G276600 [Arabis alpina]|uniref:Uncharacterized protein n=1 Tax=Arabis alpina TaxID=50452 RepID=A0A087HC40_ARAAL|nr:hypothetical protein AALP_AA3G276600 [Arabis alpina]